jgi:hypothetical protein
VQTMFCWLVLVLATGAKRLSPLRWGISFPLPRFRMCVRQSPETNEISLVTSSVARNFLLHLLLYLSCHGCLMPSFSLSCFIGADSLVPAAPVNVKRLTSEPTEETRVNLNASLPTLADQLAQAQGGCYQ